ncbi:hypothetical protein LOTGIDRAFT_234940 [Lottia gigantea]|uniref:Uncharacterized protein n=1 Tax=Lottia gigantea TaxID=225164 RepID=V4BFI5_LOTGI|nr:hypothetical protein LOTGIDRAFT_234940 [Lottia gigantea]ESO87694.1 hypothetical protein LOTGIDRAFT_234940 [Lottia gigantea]
MCALIPLCWQSTSYCDNKEESQLLKYFRQGLYEDVLGSNFGRKILKENSSTKDDLVSMVKCNIDSVLSSTDNKQQVEFDVLLVGAASLQLFIQNNWLGPVTSQPPTDFIQNQFIAQLDEKCIEDLSIDGESVYLLTRYLPYLYISYIILNQCQDSFTSLKVHSLIYAMIYQSNQSKKKIVFIQALAQTVFN